MKFPHQDPIEEQLKQLKQAVNDTVFKDWHVTDAMKTSLLERIQLEQRSRSVYQKRWLPRITAGSIVVCSVLAFLLAKPIHISDTDHARNNELHNQSLSSSLANQTAYASNVKKSQSDLDSADTRDTLPVRHTPTISTEDSVQLYNNGVITIASRHQDKPAMKVLAYTPNTSSQESTSSNAIDQNQTTVTKKTGNDVSAGSSSLIGLVAEDPNPNNTVNNNPSSNIVSGAVAVPNSIASVASTVDPSKIQQLIQLSGGNAIILGQEQNGSFDVYKLPSRVYYYGWNSDKTIGIYVQSSWKLPVTVTTGEVDLIRQSNELHLISNYNAKVTTTIPAHSPFLNMIDPVRVQLLQLAQVHQLYAVQLIDGSVDFFSSKQGDVKDNTSTDLLLGSSFSFIARISDPTLYFYPGISSITWSDLYNQIQWVKEGSLSTSSDVTNVTYYSYPMYP